MLTTRYVTLTEPVSKFVATWLCLGSALALPCNCRQLRGGYPQLPGGYGLDTLGIVEISNMFDFTGSLAPAELLP